MALGGAPRYLYPYPKNLQFPWALVGSPGPEAPGLSCPPFSLLLCSSLCSLSPCSHHTEGKCSGMSSSRDTVKASWGGCSCRGPWDPQSPCNATVESAWGSHLSSLLTVSVHGPTFWRVSEGPVSHLNGTKKSLPVGCRVKVTKLACELVSWER